MQFSEAEDIACTAGKKFVIAKNLWKQYETKGKFLMFDSGRMVTSMDLSNHTNDYESVCPMPVNSVLQAHKIIRDIIDTYNEAKLPMPELSLVFVEYRGRKGGNGELLGSIIHKHRFV